MANIRAEVAGMRDSYNKVYASFSLIPKTQVRLKGALTGDLSKLHLNMYQARKYEGDLVIRYKFLSGTQADYSGMARSYQQYLVEKHGLKLASPTPQIPFFLELLGGINKTVPVMSVPQRIVIPLTTYSQAVSILDQLAVGGITNVKLKYTGWSAGGIKHQFPLRPRLEKKLGTKRDFTALIDYRQTGYEFFPDLSFLNVYLNSWFDGFNLIKDTARFLNREAAFIYDEFNIATYLARQQEKRYIYSPIRLNWLISNFMRRYQEYQIPRLSLRFMGNQLNSDFQVQKERVVDREQTKAIVETQLRQIVEDEGKRILLTGGNVYTIPYTSYLLNVPVLRITTIMDGSPVVERAKFSLLKTPPIPVRVV